MAAVDRWLKSMKSNHTVVHGRNEANSEEYIFPAIKARVQMALGHTLIGIFQLPVGVVIARRRGDRVWLVTNNLFRSNACSTISNTLIAIAFAVYQERRERKARGRASLTQKEYLQTENSRNEIKGKISMK